MKKKLHLTWLFSPSQMGIFFTKFILASTEKIAATIFIENACFLPPVSTLDRPLDYIRQMYPSKKEGELSLLKKIARQFLPSTLIYKLRKLMHSRQESPFPLGSSQSHEGKLFPRVNYDAIWDMYFSKVLPPSYRALIHLSLLGWWPGSGSINVNSSHCFLVVQDAETNLELRPDVFYCLVCSKKTSLETFNKPSSNICFLFDSNQSKKRALEKNKALASQAEVLFPIMLHLDSDVLSNRAYVKSLIEKRSNSQLTGVKHSLVYIEVEEKLSSKTADWLNALEKWAEANRELAIRFICPLSKKVRLKGKGYKYIHFLKQVSQREKKALIQQSATYLRMDQSMSSLQRAVFAGISGIPILTFKCADTEAVFNNYVDYVYSPKEALPKLKIYCVMAKEEKHLKQLSEHLKDLFSLRSVSQRFETIVGTRYVNWQEKERLQEL